MISGYFGVPGCGKTTILARMAQKELRKIERGKSPYKIVFTNFYCKGCYRIDFLDFKYFKVRDALVLLDEISLDADNREYKSFPPQIRNFLILHRHLNVRIVYFTQDFSKVDKTIRSLTNDLWYVKKPVFPLFSQFSICKQIYRNIAINEFTSELTLGYRFATFWETLFNHTKKIVYRRPWYKYFDSYDELQLSNVPILNEERW